MGIPIIFAGILVCFLPFYIWTEYNWSQNRYLYTKLTSSLLFVLTGITALLVSDAPISYGVMIVIALALGMLGDGFLVYDKAPKFFILGLVSFLIGQIVYGSAFLSVNGFVWYDLLIWFGLFGLCVLIYLKTKIELGEMKMPVMLYCLVILFMFTMAMSSIYKGGFNPIATLFITVGAFVFLVSDIILVFHLFDKTASKSLKIFVLITYYFAQALLALSILVYSM